MTKAAKVKRKKRHVLDVFILLMGQALSFKHIIHPEIIRKTGKKSG